MRRLSLSKIVYLILLALSAIAGAYSGYTWPDGSAVADRDDRARVSTTATGLGTTMAIFKGLVAPA